MGRLFGIDNTETGGAQASPVVYGATDTPSGYAVRHAHAQPVAVRMIAKTFIIWSLLAFAAATTPCVGSTINVPADKSTIQAGIDAATDGDVVLVAPGVYPELINLNGKAITLKGLMGARVTTIDGQLSGPVITMHSFEGPSTIVEGFTITRGAAHFGAGAYLLGSAPTFRRNVFLKNTQFAGGFGAAIAGFNGSPVVEGNEFVDNTCDDQFLSGVLSFVNSSSPAIYNNVFHDNDCRAINMTIPSGAAPVVFNNTIVRNRTGIYIDHRISNSSQTFRNNLIAQNDIGLEVTFEFTPFDAIWTNNLMFGNAIDFMGTSDLTGSNGNLKVDPHLVDPPNGDFHLRPGSPALDAGTSGGLALPLTDFDGSPRVRDDNGDGLAAIDIGAFEGALTPVATAEPVPLNSRISLLLGALGVLILAGVERRSRY